MVKNAESSEYEYKYLSLDVKGTLCKPIPLVASIDRLYRTSYNTFTKYRCRKQGEEKGLSTLWSSMGLDVTYAPERDHPRENIRDRSKQLK